MNQIYIALAIAAAGFTAGWTVCDWRNDAQQLAVQNAIVDTAAAIGVENSKIGEQLEKKLANLKIVNRTINNEVQREIHKEPVYLNADCAIPESGVRLLNSARGYPAPKPGVESAAPVSAPAADAGKKTPPR